MRILRLSHRRGGLAGKYWVGRAPRSGTTILRHRIIKIALRSKRLSRVAMGRIKHFLLCLKTLPRNQIRLPHDHSKISGARRMAMLMLATHRCQTQALRFPGRRTDFSRAYARSSYARPAWSARPSCSNRQRSWTSIGTCGHASTAYCSHRRAAADPVPRVRPESWWPPLSK